MPRNKTILQSDFPYSIGARSINKEWFNLPLDLVWEIMSNHLHSTHHRFNLQIHAFVLMSNHFHLLASTPDGNLSQCMAYFMKATSSELTFAGNRINQTYSGRHYRTIIGSYHYFMNSYKYVYRNPVKAGLCANVQDYKFSTLHGLLGNSKLIIPVVEDTLLFDDVDGIIKWINVEPDASDWKTVSDALKKREFKMKKGSKKGALHRLENELL